jgi:hypothetical protein
VKVGREDNRLGVFENRALRKRKRQRDGISADG